MAETILTPEAVLFNHFHPALILSVKTGTSWFASCSIPPYLCREGVHWRRPHMLWCAYSRFHVCAAVPRVYCAVAVPTVRIPLWLASSTLAFSSWALSCPPSCGQTGWKQSWRRLSSSNSILTILILFLFCKIVVEINVCIASLLCNAIKFIVIWGIVKTQNVKVLLLFQKYR